MAKFPFAIWNYNYVGDFTTDEVDVWADCGLTVTMSPKVRYGKDDPALLIPMLDRAQERGIQLIACIVGLENVDYKVLGQEAYAKRFTEVYNILKHPALYGFYIGDEPSTKEDFQASWDSIKCQRVIAPELRPCLNLHTGMDATKPELLGGRTFREWLRDMAADTGFSNFSYGHYDQVVDEYGIDSSFRNIRPIVEAAEQANVDVWNCQLSSAHYMFRIPNYYEILWQITVPAACGSRGVLWFRFYDRAFGPNYHGSPIDEYGNKTPLYYDMFRAQRRFNDHYGELIMSLHHKATYVTKQAFGGYPIYDDALENPIPEMDKISGTEPAVIGIFENDEGEQYFCIVNESMDKPGVWKLFFDREKYELDELMFNGRDENAYGASNSVDHWDGLWLYPGQMAMFKFKKK